MKKNFLFKWVSILGAVLLLATSVMPGLTKVYAKSYSENPESLGLNWEYIYNEATWNEAYANPTLQAYYAWSDQANAPYKEDLWNSASGRAANINDAHKTNDEYDLDENGNYIYDNCERNWSGAVSAPWAKYPWAVVSIPKPFTWTISFSYNGWEPVYPWGEAIRSFTRGFGIASIPEEFKNNSFLIPENAGIANSEWEGEVGEASTFDPTKLVITLIQAHSLTIHYVYSNWDEAAEDYTWELLDWADYSVVSPKIGDYTASIATVSGTITADVEVTVTYAKSEMTITATKLATVPDDLNKEDAQANQDAVTITQEWNNIIVKGKLDQLKTYNSTNPNQGEHQWVWIILTTNLESITGAKWNGSQLMQADIDEGATVWLNSKQIIYWTKVDVIKDTPAEIAITASGYEDVNLTVSFEEKTEEKSNRSSWWWGGWSSRTTKSDDTKATTWDNAKVDETNAEENNEEKANDENKDEEKAPMTDAQAVEKFGQEQIDAYKWALGNGITTMKTVEAARLDEPLTRAELAKMMVVYIQKVLEKDPILTGDVNYSDVGEELGDLFGYIKLAYQYQIMWINADGTPIELFNPYGLVTRWEYATVFSRVLFGDKFNKTGEDFYTKHLEALKAAWILTNTIPTIQEMRGWVMLMMYRSSQNAEKIENVANTTETNEEEKADEETATASDETKSEANEEEKAEEATNAEATTWDVAETPTAEASAWDTASN